MIHNGFGMADGAPARGDAWRGARRPAIYVNQAGALTGEPLSATIATDAEEPLEVTLRDSADEVVWRGTSQPWHTRPEPTSGLTVHTLTVPTAPAPGAGYWLSSGMLRSHSFDVGITWCEDLADDALHFFRLMRSGQAITDTEANAYTRPAGHSGIPPNTGDTAVPAWTGPDAERLYPGWRCPGLFDVSGGWYDAGDFGKYVTSGSIALWQLLSTTQLPGIRAPFAERIRDECRWQLDWLLRMQVPPGAPLAGMVFHRVHGTTWPPMPCWPHLDPTSRVLHRPSSVATWQLAAAAAHATRLFSQVDPDYAAALRHAAVTAYDAAATGPLLTAPDDHAAFGGGPYADEDPSDDAYWAACELWLATGHDRYRADLTANPWHHQGAFRPGGFDFDAVAAVGRLDLALHGSLLPDHDPVVSSVVDAADALLRLQTQQPWGQPYAPAEGWGWGSNGRILNNLVVLAAASQLTGERRYVRAMTDGLGYLLGRNALGQSYVTGYGADHSHHQRTRQFGHDLNPALPPPPPGSLAGGANSQPSPDFPYDDHLLGLPPQLCYLDVPTSEVTNDVCIRWNAPLVYISAALSVREASADG